MVVVSILGILSSLAVPAYKGMVFKARKAERDQVMQTLGTGLVAQLNNEGALKVNARGVLTRSVSLAANPPLPVGTVRKPFNPQLGNWPQLQVQLKGSTYYSWTISGTTTGAGARVVITARGDVDGNRRYNVKAVTYAPAAGSWSKVSEVESGDRF